MRSGPFQYSSQFVAYTALEFVLFLSSSLRTVDGNPLLAGAFIGKYIVILKFTELFRPIDRLGNSRSWVVEPTKSLVLSDCFRGSLKTSSFCRRPRLLPCRRSPVTLLSPHQGLDVGTSFEGTTTHHHRALLLRLAAYAYSLTA